MARRKRRSRGYGNSNYLNAGIGLAGTALGVAAVGAAIKSF
jgi:hypothetical protein